MSRADAILASAVQIAGPLTRVQDRIVAVKMHPDAVSVLQLHSTLDEWKLERLVSWSLEAPVGRAPVRDNFPYLVDQIAAAATEAAVDGVDAGIAIPASYFDTRLLTLPYFPEADLAAEADEPEFWEEFDPELTNLDGRISRHQILYSNENEDRTLVLFSSIAESDIDRYRGLLLDANLLPVFLENELFSMINGVYARLDVDDLFKPFSVLHICPGNNYVICSARGRLAMQKIKISDFDEALLEELEGLDSVDGEFWEEVAIRVSEQIRQAVAFIAEEQEFQEPDKLFLVSEYKVLDNMVSLLADRLDPIRIMPYDAMADVEMPNEHAKYVDYFRNNSVFTSAIGLATQGLDIEGRAENAGHRRLISMNFLPTAVTIKRNRQLAAVNRILSVAIIGVLVLSGALLGINTVPAYLQTREAARQYDTAKSYAQTQKLLQATNEKKLTEVTQVNINLRKMSRQRGYAEFMSQLPAMIPATAELQKMELREDGKLSISGLAMSNDDINTIKQNFKTMKFTRREPQVTSKREDPYWAFSIDTDLVKAK